MVFIGLKKLGKKLTILDPKLKNTRFSRDIDILVNESDIQKTYELMNDPMDPLKAKLVEASLNLSTGLATLYEVYCKD